MDADLEAQIERALAEDVGDGDATTTTASTVDSVSAVGVGAARST
jgi:nicotinate-nucleotide pyrophosphorylase